MHFIRICATVTMTEVSAKPMEGESGLNDSLLAGRRNFNI